MPGGGRETLGRKEHPDMFGHLTQRVTFYRRSADEFIGLPGKFGGTLDKLAAFHGFFQGAFCWIESSM